MISKTAVRTPLVLPIEHFYNLLGQDFFYIAEQYNVIFPMEIDPASVTLFRVTALHCNTFCRVKDLIKCLFLDITENNIKILTQGDVPIRVDDKRVSD